MKIEVNFSCKDEKEAVGILASIANEAQHNSVYCKTINDFTNGERQRVGSMTVIPDKDKKAPPFNYAFIRDFKVPESKIENVLLPPGWLK